MNRILNCEDSCIVFYSKELLYKTLVYLSVDYTIRMIISITFPGADYILADSDCFSNVIMSVIQRESEQEFLGISHNKSKTKKQKLSLSSLFTLFSFLNQSFLSTLLKMLNNCCFCINLR